MITIDQKMPSNTPASECLRLPFEARCKSRLRTQLETGETVGLLLERGAVLRPGDRLQASDGRIIEVLAAPEALMETRSNDALLLARAAYHLGNRHVAVQINPGLLRFAHDHVLAEMLQGLGLIVQEIQAPFDPESGAYGGYGGHAHGHNADGEGRGARIHDKIVL